MSLVNCLVKVTSIGHQREAPGLNGQPDHRRRVRKFGHRSQAASQIGTQSVTDPALGVWWFRESGGDWTTSRMRQVNPYAPLFYSVGHEREHSSFHNGGIQDEIGRMLAVEVVRLLPELRDRGNLLVTPITDRLGWEIVSTDLPVIRVWSHFSYLGPGDATPVNYRLGGVLSFGVSDHLEPESGDVVYQYLVVGDFLGDVVLEDAGT